MLSLAASVNWSLKKEKSSDSRPAKAGSFLGQHLTALALKTTSAASISLMVLERSSLAVMVACSRLSMRVAWSETLQAVILFFVSMMSSLSYLMRFAQSAFFFMPLVIVWSSVSL